MSYVTGSELKPGTLVSGYRVEALIGRGGMGAVYRASEEGLERKVALKVIAPELAQDERFRERFLRESRLAASLDHPHVIPIYQAGEEQGLLYLAMRYVEGTDLAGLLAQEGVLDPRRALELLAQIAEALDAAHARGLVHRDVKPSNVLIAEAAGREHCYLGDFGLTKRTGSLSGVSVAGDIVGTLEYVAPEQITGEPLDERSDVYSLGCVLYESLTGQAPFPRATDVALLWAHVHEEPTPPSRLRPELPRELDPVLARALAKEPARRYRSAGELIAATRSAFGMVEAPQVRTRTSRRRLIMIAAAVALLGALAAAALGFMLIDDSPSDLASVAPNSVGVIDPKSNRLVSQVPVGRAPQAIATGQKGVWVANVGDRTIQLIDPTDGRAANIDVPGYPSDVAVGRGSVLVALGAVGKLVQINPVRYAAASPIAALGDEAARCGGPEASLAVGRVSAWLVCGDGKIGRINLQTGASRLIGLEYLLTSFDAKAPRFSDVAFGLGLVYIVNRKTNTVVVLDPSTNKGLFGGPGGGSLGQQPEALTVGADSVWVANFKDDTVRRIAFPQGPGQPFPPTITDIDVGDGPVDVSFGEGGVWVANKLDRSLTRIDPESGDVVATIKLGNEPQRVAAGEGSVWVTVRAANSP